MASVPQADGDHDPVATGTPDDVRQAARLYMASTAELVELLRGVDPRSDPAGEIVSRGIVCRQHDYLEVALTVGVVDCGFALLPLVRPAVEELIWLTLLAEIDPPKRDRLVLALTLLGATADLDAQASFAGAAYMEENGLHGIAQRFSAAKRDARRTVKQVFTEAGFSLGRGRHMPSVRDLAEHGGRLELYQFLYHASSTAVHFKPDQIMRGIWGERRSMRIDLRQVAIHRADFSIFWLVWLARETLRTAIPMIGDVELPAPNSGALAEVDGLLATRGFPPFISAGEFRM